MPVTLPHRLIVATAAVLLLSSPRPAPAQAQSPAAPAVTLKVGDPAPPLKTGKWIKGEPVKKFEPGTVYVIECWATWCVPCIAAMPHVTELQKKYGDKVVFIGQNVLEEDEETVAPFVEKMGEKIGYRVALDDKSADPKGAMVTTWMTAAGRDAVPCTFIVDKAGKLAWIGLPKDMDKSLADIVAQKSDATSAATNAK